MQENSTIPPDQNPEENPENTQNIPSEEAGDTVFSGELLENDAELPGVQDEEVTGEVQAEDAPEADIQEETAQEEIAAEEIPAEVQSDESEAPIPAEEAIPDEVEAVLGVTPEDTAAISEEPVTEVQEAHISEPSDENSHSAMLVVEEHELEEMENQEAENQTEDYSGLDLEQLVKLAEQLNRDNDPAAGHRVIQKLKPIFDGLFLKEKNEALEKFVADGGDKESYEFKHQGLEQRFNQAGRGINEKRKISQEFQQKERSRNLEAKLLLLEQLRQVVDDYEHNPDYEKFRQIKEEWKKIGPVGSDQAKNLNASYYALLDRFHGNSEKFNWLRDLDRKKNLDLKQEIIGKIEKLAQESSISKVMKDLISYQDDYRSLGPVPKEKLDELKERLKKAVDVLYERRKEFNEQRKQWLAEEISLKEALAEKIADFEHFVGQTARDWQAKTKELLVLQEEWKAVPNRFREKTAELNKKFWNVYKKYMHNKNEFFRELDKGKKDVIARKQALVDEVNSLKDGEDWDGIVNRMKELQAEWKQLPALFGKEGQKIYDAFRAGIDHFFNRLRERRSGEDKVQNENLEKKEEVCRQIEEKAEAGLGSRDLVEQFRDEFRNIGFVPMKSIQKVNGRFTRAMMDLIEKSTLIPKEEKEKFKINLLNNNKSLFSSEGVKSLKNQEGYIRNRLQQLKKDHGNLEDNMAMFKMSKNAMALIEDIQKRANLLKLEINELESQLKEIRAGESQA
jgi:hypothetical protein